MRLRFCRLRRCFIRREDREDTSVALWHAATSLSRLGTKAVTRRFSAMLVELTASVCAATSELQATERLASDGERLGQTTEQPAA